MFAVIHAAGIGAYLECDDVHVGVQICVLDAGSQLARLGVGKAMWARAE